MWYVKTSKILLQETQHLKLNELGGFENGYKAEYNLCAKDLFGPVGQLSRFSSPAYSLPQLPPARNELVFSYC